MTAGGASAAARERVVADFCAVVDRLANVPLAPSDADVDEQEPHDDEVNGATDVDDDVVCQAAVGVVARRMPHVSNIELCNCFDYDD